MKLRVLALHPIQYQAPLWTVMARHPEVRDFRVWFTWKGLSGKAAYDPGFGRTFSWDVDLTGTYPHAFLMNLAWRPQRGGSFSRINPGVILALLKDRPDALIVMGHGTISAVLALAASRLLGIPTLLFGDYSRPARNWLSRLRLGVVRLASAGAAVGVRNRRLYEEAGFEPDRIVSVPFCVDNRHFSRPPGAPRREGVPLVVCVAKLVPWKRQRDLLEALALLPECSRPRLRLVGSGPDEPELRRLSERLGLDGSVEWQGFVNYGAMPAQYWAADAAILASEHEPWGLTVNEAMAAGLPVMVSEACGCVDDLVLDGVTGHRFPVADLSAIAALLRDLRERPERWRVMEGAALERVGRYDASVAADALVRAAAGLRAR